MDLALNEQQEMLKKSARDFLKKECPASLVRQMQEDEKGYSLELWHKMADLGWMGLVIPQEYGGVGADLIDLVILLEEMGQVLAPVPFLQTVVSGGMTILAGGSEEQKKYFLPKIASGELIMSLALTEPGISYGLVNIATRATKDEAGGEWTIDGTKLFVPYAHVADYFLCVARTGDSGEAQQDLSLFLVDGKNPGISCSLLQTIASDKQFEVTFDSVRVQPGNMLGGLNGGWGIISQSLERSVISQCAMMVGSAQRVLEMTTDYAKERIQFDRPIGSFQVIQHKLADMLVEVNGAQYLTYEAAWRLSQGLTTTEEVSAAKAWANQTFQHACAEAQQIHGGYGIDMEYDLPLYTRQAEVAAQSFGDAYFHREVIARQLCARSGDSLSWR